VCSVPPTWENEPTDVAVERGRSAMLNCRAKGVPPPVTVWKKAAGKDEVCLYLFMKQFPYLPVCAPQVAEEEIMKRSAISLK